MVFSHSFIHSLVALYQSSIFLSLLDCSTLVTFDSSTILFSLLHSSPQMDSFAFIRGIADYLDGTKNVDWQPYAALCAAAYTKTLITDLPPPGHGAAGR